MRIVSALVVLLGAAAAARAQDVTVSLALDRADVAVGDDVQAEVSVSNPGDKDVEIAELVFEERSLSFEVTFDAGGGKTKTFTYAVQRPDPHVAERSAPARVTLKAKKAVTGLFKIPTLRSGAMSVAAVYKGSGKEIKSAPLSLKVAPQGEAGRLAAAVETSQGAFQIDLNPEAAPNTVANFVALAKRGFYDGLTVHRVVKNGWIQTGCPYDNGTGGPGFAVRSEAEGQKDVRHDLGTVSMAGNLKSGFSGSQFFVTLGKQSSFDAKFTSIGSVSGAGLDVLKKIGAVETDKTSDRPLKDVKVSSVKIIAVK
jgi:peptidyl-prolyl cis-trans isomerase B (cyclophilin B)